MAKTNPIGVRFREDILESLKTKFNVHTPQKALVFLERFYVTHSALAKDIKQVLRDDKVNVHDLNKPNKEVKDLSKIPSKSNFSIDTRPKTLEELKKICPPDLTGFDRSEWISQNRVKYGI